MVNYYTYHQSCDEHDIICNICMCNLIVMRGLVFQYFTNKCEYVIADTITGKVLKNS